MFIMNTLDQIENMPEPLVNGRDLCCRPAANTPRLACRCVCTAVVDLESKSFSKNCVWCLGVCIPRVRISSRIGQRVGRSYL